VFLIQPLTTPVEENLVELLLMADAARGASAARMTAVMPHFAYARSDKKAPQGRSVLTSRGLPANSPENGARGKELQDPSAELASAAQ
jgi:phosphoribosylpyrophosphate synthetase